MEIRKLAALSFGLATLFISSRGFAADLTAADCAVSGEVQAGENIRQITYPNGPAAGDKNQWIVYLNGKAAVNYSCNHWNYQLIAAGTNYFPDRYSFGAGGYTHSEIEGGLEGDVFWRDPQSYALGLGIEGSAGDTHVIGFGSVAGRDYHDTFQSVAGVAFAEVYLNDVTLGATGFFRNGNALNGFTGINAQVQTFGGSAYARYYLTPNLRFSVRGNVSQATNFANNNVTTSYTGVLSADYKFENSPVSLFTAVRYGGSNSTLPSIYNPSSDLEGEIGISIALGNFASGSLLEQNRNGTSLH